MRVLVWLGVLPALLVATTAEANPGPAPAEPVRPATEAAGRVLAVVQDIARRVVHTRYQHPTLVRPLQGVYLWDCSGMAAWILGKAARGARASVHSVRPVARDFYRAITAAPAQRERGGWQRLTRLEEARPGDVFAWLRPPDWPWPRRNTGHVGFVLAPPRPVQGLPGAYTVRIADATSIPHQDDTRGWPGEGGFGTGTLMFMTDSQGAPTHYGWFGSLGGFTARTSIAFGRVVR
jgi:hypothetical protein